MAKIAAFRVQLGVTLELPPEWVPLGVAVTENINIYVICASKPESPASADPPPAAPVEARTLSVADSPPANPESSVPTAPVEEETR